MARKNKPVKIKRYRNSMGTSSQSKAAIKRLIPFVAAAVAVVVLGFLLGRPIINFIAGIGENGDSQPDSQQPSAITTPRPTPQPENTPVVPEATVRPQPTPQPDATETEKVYFYANVADMANEAGLAKVIDRAKAAGATHLVFDVKNPDGYVHYASSDKYASQLGHDVQLDLAAVTAELKAEGITPVARIYTFMDKMISTVERSTAVMYQGTETRWLDTSAALGGKAWANPASKIMQDYIISLTDEIMSMGIREFIFAGFHTPTGYSLDKRDFGANIEQVVANMQSLRGTLEAKISAKGGYSSWQVEYTAVMPEGNYAHYVVHPYQLGAENYIVTAKGRDTDVAAALAALQSSQTAEDISSITLWLTDNVNAGQTESLGHHFVY